MRAGTHIVAGVAVGYAAGSSAGLEWSALIAFGALCGLVALMADIDHPQSAIRRKTGVLGTLAAFWMNHRGVSHTLPAAGLVWLLSSLVAAPLLALAVGAAYTSHIILDACTPSGVPLLWPASSRRVHLLPRGLRVPTGSFAEKGVLLALVALLYVSAAGMR